MGSGLFEHAAEEVALEVQYGRYVKFAEVSSFKDVTCGRVLLCRSSVA
jgi:hypothetical protein